MPQLLTRSTDARAARRRNRYACHVAALLALLVAPRAAAADEHEEPEATHALSVSAGLGFSFPYENQVAEEAAGVGGYGKAEYIYRSVEWATPRAYVGVLVTSPDDACGFTPCDVSAKIVFVGVKGRLLVAIPYVAPFLELGLGGSVGSMSTRVGSFVDVTARGLMYHVPFALGLALGARHQFELSFSYLFHPEQQQYTGALAIGFMFPLDLE